MKNLIKRPARPADTKLMIPRFSRMNLTRNFVETGDERCPVAGIWSRLEAGAMNEEAELPRPVIGRLLLWRALSFPCYIAALQ